MQRSYKAVRLCVHLPRGVNKGGTSDACCDSAAHNCSYQYTAQSVGRRGRALVLDEDVGVGKRPFAGASVPSGDALTRTFAWRPSHGDGGDAR